MAGAEKDESPKRHALSPTCTREGFGTFRSPHFYFNPEITAPQGASQLPLKARRKARRKARFAPQGALRALRARPLSFVYYYVLAAGHMASNPQL